MKIEACARVYMNRFIYQNMAEFKRRKIIQRETVLKAVYI
jgi:hypothetical protein